MLKQTSCYLNVGGSKEFLEPAVGGYLDQEMWKFSEKIVIYYLVKIKMS